MEDCIEDVRPLASSGGLSGAYFLLFTVTFSVMLLNVLIAKLNDSYAAIVRSAEVSYTSNHGMPLSSPYLPFLCVFLVFLA